MPPLRQVQLRLRREHRQIRVVRVSLHQLEQVVDGVGDELLVLLDSRQPRADDRGLNRDFRLGAARVGGEKLDRRLVQRLENLRVARVDVRRVRQELHHAVQRGLIFRLHRQRAGPGLAGANHVFRIRRAELVERVAISHPQTRVLRIQGDRAREGLDGVIVLLLRHRQRARRDVLLRRLADQKLLGHEPEQAQAHHQDGQDDQELAVYTTGHRFTRLKNPDSLSQL